MSERSTFLNAVIGAAVSVVFAFLPFSTVLGGAVAGYLQRGDYYEGAKVGAISGLLATIPIALFATFVAAFLVIVPTAGGEVGVGLFFGVLFVIVGAIVLVYTVGLSALGGVLGVAVADEFGGNDEYQDEAEYRRDDSVGVEAPVRTTEEERQDER